MEARQRHGVLVGLGGFRPPSSLSMCSASVVAMARRVSASQLADPGAVPPVLPVRKQQRLCVSRENEKKKTIDFALILLFSIKLVSCDSNL
jgi:hypothetical protein